MRQSSDATTILVSVRDKRRLDKKKLHPREPYRDVLRRVLDEADLYEGRGKAHPGSQSQHELDRIEQSLGKIVKGKLATWSTSDRPHEKLLFDEVAKQYE